MRLTTQSVQYWGQCPVESEEMLKRIEAAGRTCYASTDKITEDSAVDFCERMLQSGHYSVLEHSNIVLKITDSEFFNPKIPVLCAENLYITLGERSKFHNLHTAPTGTYVNGNVRAWLETLEHTSLTSRDVLGYMKRAIWSELISLLKTPVPVGDSAEIVMEYNEIPHPLRKFTFRLTTNRAISHQIVRHRIDCAYSQSSQRYCNYSSDKFGNEVSFIVPLYCKELIRALDVGADLTTLKNDNSATWLGAMQFCEQVYFKMIKDGLKPQQARGVLPNDCQTEIVMTAGGEALDHFFKLRLGAGADPMIQNLAQQMKDAYFKGA